MKRKINSALIVGAILILLFPASSFGQKASESGTITVDEFNLPYKIEGEGEAALVIGSSIYYPRAFSQRLRKHLKFVFLDHRGFAPSPGKLDTTSYSLAKILQDMEAARQQLNLGKIIVIGHSGHSFMALEYAKKYPESNHRRIPDRSCGLPVDQCNLCHGHAVRRNCGVRTNRVRPDGKIAWTIRFPGNVHGCFLLGDRCFECATAELPENSVRTCHGWSVLFKGCGDQS